MPEGSAPNMYPTNIAIMRISADSSNGVYLRKQSSSGIIFSKRDLLGRKPGLILYVLKGAPAAFAGMLQSKL